MRIKKMLLVALTILAVHITASNLANAQGGRGAPAQGGQGGGQRAPGGFPPPLRLVSPDIDDGQPIAGKVAADARAKDRPPRLQRAEGARGNRRLAESAPYLAHR